MNALDDLYRGLRHDRTWYRLYGHLLRRVDDLQAENRAAIRALVQVRWTARHPHPGHDIENCVKCEKAWEFYGLRVAT